VIKLKLFNTFKKRKKSTVLTHEEFINETLKYLPEESRELFLSNVAYKCLDSWILFLDE
jgi:hypothetical protein